MARLIFVTGTSPDVEGGSGTYVGISVLREALVRAGHRVDLVCPEPGGGPISLARRIAFDLRARETVRRLESAVGAGADAVIGFDLDGIFLAGGRAPRVAAIKGTAAEEARFESGWPRVRLATEGFLEGIHVRRAQLVLAPSRHSAAGIADVYGVPAGRIALVPEPIDLGRWRGALAAARDAAAAAPEPRGERTILCVAHLYPRKDVSTLLDALARLPAGVRLRVVGTGPEQANLVRRAEELGLAARAEFLGHVPFRRLAEEYAGADLFCLPSRQEGFGIVFLEAMAAGLPIVAARAAAVPEVVGDGEEAAGILVPPSDAAALADALRRVLDRPELHRKLGEAGRRRVERFDAAVVAEKFLASLSAAASQPRGHEPASYRK